MADHSELLGLLRQRQKTNQELDRVRSELDHLFDEVVSLPDDESPSMLSLAQAMGHLAEKQELLARLSKVDKQIEDSLVEMSVLQSDS